MRLRNWLFLFVVLSLIPIGTALARPASVQDRGAAAGRDTDGDKIPDAVEKMASYKNADPREGQPAPSHKHKDVWVVVDYMKGLKPHADTAGYVIDAFANSPLTNPDGKKGVNLHIIEGTQMKFEKQWGDVTKQAGYMTTYNKLKTARGDLANPWDVGGPTGAPAPTSYVHYAAYINQISAQGTSGISMDSTNPGGGIPGDMFIVSLGGPWGAEGKKATTQAGTFMHELGHNIGLAHGGAAAKGAGFDDTHTNYKPNYLSVMNYDFQFGFYGMQGENIVLLEYWDYSTWKADTLDENKLSEPAGVKAPMPVAKNYLGVQHCGNQAFVFEFNTPVTWDCDAKFNEKNLHADINSDGQMTKLGSQDNWDNLIWDGGAVAGAGASIASVAAPRDDLDIPTYQNQQLQLARAGIVVRPEGHSH